MKTMKIFFSFLLVVLLASCGSDDEPVYEDSSAIYKIVLEASGQDYTANAHIVNSDNIPFQDISSGNSEKTSVDEYFTGKKTYVTSDKVQYISVQGVILSDMYASLTMSVYRDGKQVYHETVTVPDADNTTKALYYTNINK